jgi:hypothetical protein
MLALLLSLASLYPASLAAQADGPVRELHPNGEVAVEGKRADGVPAGKWTWYWENGKRKEQGSFRDGLRTGTWRTFHPDGSLGSKGKYDDGWRDGEWEFTGADGERDELRSGVYAHAVETAHATRGEGETLGGHRQGRWTWSVDGGARIECGYLRGALHGPRTLVHASGARDPEICAATFEGGARLDPDASAPGEDAAADPPDAAREPGDPGPLELPADGPARAARTRFVESWNAWSALGPHAALGPEESAAAAEHAAALADLAGGWSYPMDASDAPSLDLARDRWRSFYSLATASPVAWTVDAAVGAGVLGVGYAESVVARPPLPPILAGSEKPQTAGFGMGTGRAMLETVGYASALRAQDRALEWLADAQAEDGSWEPANDAYRLATTSHAAIAFGTALRGDAADPRPTAAALGWIVARQDPESGAIGGGNPTAEPTYQHALATWVLGELAGARPTAGQRVALERAARFLLQERSPDGHWDRPGDAATLHAMLALRVAQLRGAEVDDAVLEDAARWSESLIDATGRAGAKRPAEGELSPGSCPDATGLVVVALAFAERKLVDGEPLQRGAAWITRGPPDASVSGSDPRMLLYGLLASLQIGGTAGKAWFPVYDAVADAQRRDGSWPASGVVAATGGDVLATALFTQACSSKVRYRSVLR